MNTKQIGIWFLWCGFLFLAGCGDTKKGKFTEEQMRRLPLANRYDLPAASGGMVMSVYEQTITANEVLLAAEKDLVRIAKSIPIGFKEKALPVIRQTIRSKAADILLYHEARRKAPSNTNIDEALEKAVEQEMVRFLASFDNNYALAEQRIRSMGMDWRTFREYQKKMIMTQSYLSTQLDKKPRFSHSQMLDFYQRHRQDLFCQPGRVEFSAIDLDISKIRPESPEQSASQAAQSLARQIVQQLQEGADFAELAKQYSHTLASAGGKWAPVLIGKNSLAEPYDSLETMALQMEIGSVSEPIENQGHIFIVKLHDKQPPVCKEFHEVQAQVEREMLMEYRQKEYEAFVDKLIKQVDFVEMERFAEFCVELAAKRYRDQV